MIGMTKSVRRGLEDRLILVVAILILLSVLTPISQADGGVVMCQRNSAPFAITLFVNEMPLRPGPADLSVLVEPTNEHSAILDAQVFLELEHQAGTIIRAEATRSQARNKLLYCSVINLTKSGKWKMKLHVIRGESKAEVYSDLLVAAPQPVLVSYWKLFALPPIAIILFLINQWLRRRQFN